MLDAKPTLPRPEVAVIALPVTGLAGVLMLTKSLGLRVPLMGSVDRALFLGLAGLCDPLLAHARSILDGELASTPNILAAAAGQHGALVTTARTPLVVSHCVYS